ncbi:hypothetical protein REPUB_Repub14bG0018500 [Reevesia pubescens]
MMISSLIRMVTPPLSGTPRWVSYSMFPLVSYKQFSSKGIGLSPGTGFCYSVSTQDSYRMFMVHGSYSVSKQALLTDGMELHNMVLPAGVDSEASDAFGSESWSHLLCSPSSETEGTGTPMNKPVPSANHPVPSSEEEAGPANRAPPIVPYPYQLDEVIEGDSVLSI